METSRVFVSHTSGMADFPEDRSFVRAALDAVTKMAMVPVEMRHFPAAGTKPADYCRERVAGCEIYVGLIGFQYGSIVPGELVSYTELEFNAAGAAELHRLVFLLRDTDGMPPGLVDDDPVPAGEFRSRLRNAELTVATFASADELELKVFQALTALPRPAPRAVRYSLPPGTATFVGRDAEVDRITAAGGRGVVAIRGMPGGGKTALAVHAAHLLRNQFPDRQLFTDLHAHTPGQDPVPPEVALAGLLTAAGVDPRYLPGSLAARTDMWRDRMAGQRVLLVLDNAGSSAQVTPLLPGDGAVWCWSPAAAIWVTCPGLSRSSWTLCRRTRRRPCSGSWLRRQPPARTRRWPRWCGWPATCRWRSRCWRGCMTGTRPGPWPI